MAKPPVAPRPAPILAPWITPTPSVSIMTVPAPPMAPIALPTARTLPCKQLPWEKAGMATQRHQEQNTLPDPAQYPTTPHPRDSVQWDLQDLRDWHQHTGIYVM